MNKEIYDVVINCVQEFNQHLEHKIDVLRGEQAGLFGVNGVLDSLGLVSFIVEVEQAIEDDLNVSVHLASEKAMSQKSSPFLTIGTLVAFVEQLVNEAKNND